MDWQQHFKQASRIQGEDTTVKPPAEKWWRLSAWKVTEVAALMLIIERAFSLFRGRGR